MRTTTSRWLAAMALLASLSYSLPAATVTAMVQRVTGAWATNSVISLFPSNTPAVYNGGFASSASARMTVSSNGWSSNRLEMGTYKFSIDQSTRDVGTVFIPDGDGTYNLWSLISSTNVTFNTNINIHVLQSDFLTASNYLASLGGGGGSAFGVWSNATLIATNPVALRWTNAGNVTFTLVSNAAGVSISATVDLGVTNALATLEAATFLTNWINAVSNYANTKQHGSAILSNAVGTGILTNSAEFVLRTNGTAFNLAVTALANTDVALTVTNATGRTNDVLRALGTNQTAGLRVGPTGNVGVGTNVATAALEVAGLTNLMQLSVPSNSGVPPLMIDFNESQSGGRKMIYVLAGTGSSPQQMKLVMRDKVGYGVDLIANGAGVANEFRVDKIGSTPLLSASDAGIGVNGIIKMGGGAPASVGAFQGNVNLHAPSAGTLVVSNGSAGYATVTLSNVMAKGFLEMVQIAATNAPATDSVRLFAANVSGTAELIAEDEAGNVVQLTSHPADAPPAFYIVTNWTKALPRISKTVNRYIGVVEWNGDTANAMLRQWELRGTNFNALGAAMRQQLADALRAEETFAEYNTRMGYTNGHPEALVRANWVSLQAQRQAGYDAARVKELEEFNTPLTVTNDAGAVIVLPNNTNVTVRAARDIRKPQPHWLKDRVDNHKEKGK